MYSGSLKHLLPIPLLARVYVTALLCFGCKTNAVSCAIFWGISLYEIKSRRSTGEATHNINNAFVEGMFSKTPGAQRFLGILRGDESLENALQVGQRFVHRKSTRKEQVEPDLVQSAQDITGNSVNNVRHLKKIGEKGKDSFLVPILAEYGFEYHDVKAKQVTMTRWLPDTPSALTLHACNWHSVSGLVLDKKGRILLVKEHKRIRYGWTFPGGHANDCEPIFETAKRKVAEETGIKAEPQAIIALQHKVAKVYSHVGTLFFHCLMRVNYDSGDEEAELAVAPEGFSTWWFTRDELRDMDPGQFYRHHRKIFMAYDSWLSTGGTTETFSTLKDGSSISHMFFFSSV